ncbi:MAG: hypothetical protein Q9187_003325 [Circinaria calcarea]
MVDKADTDDSARTDQDSEGWIQETIDASERDTRRQPWKATFANTVDCGFGDSMDLVVIEKSNGGVPDPLCPFKTQGSSLAA